MHADTASWHDVPHAPLSQAGASPNMPEKVYDLPLWSLFVMLWPPAAPAHEIVTVTRPAALVMSPLLDDKPVLSPDR